MPNQIVASPNAVLKLPFFKPHFLTLVLFATVFWFFPIFSFAEDSSIHQKSALPEQSTLFPFKRQFIDVTDYFTEDNLKFDVNTNPAGIFTSEDDDIGTFSDAKARQELVELNIRHKKSLVSYVDVGDPNADPIVLFHGIPTSFFEWREIIPVLAEHGRVIAFDQLGQGYSSKHRSLNV